MMFFILGYRYRMASLDGNWDKIVPNVSHSAINKPYWAPAGSGGGGGNGPTIQVSTIQFGPGLFGLGTIDITEPTTLVINNATTAAVNDIQFTTANSTEYPSPATFIEINAPGSGNSLKIVAQDSGESLIQADDTIQLVTSSISLLAPTSISSLTVSTINGVVPGGGGSAGPDLTVSTLTVSDSGSINFDTQLLLQSSGNGQALFTKAIDNTNVAIQATDGNAVVYLGAVNGMGGGYIATAYNQPLNILPSTIISTLTVSTLNQGSLGNLSIGGSVSVFNQLACSAVSTNVIAPVSGTNVTISSILVSSINNASYPPQSSLYPFISSINPGGGGGTQTQYFCSTNSEAQVLTTFETQLGHNYQLNLPFFISTFNAPTYGDALLIGHQGAGATDLIYTLPLIQGATWNVPLVFKNTVADGPVQVLLGTNTTYPVEVNLGSSSGAELIDLGPSSV